MLKVFKADAVVRADTETYNSSSTPLDKKIPKMRGVSQNAQNTKRFGWYWLINHYAANDW